MHWQEAPAEWEGAAAPLLLTLGLLGLLAWVLYFTAVMQLHFSKVLNTLFLRLVFAFPVSFNYGCIQDTVMRHFLWSI